MKRPRQASRRLPPRRDRHSPFATLGVALLVLGGCSDELPPLGEALLIVDTDAPVPQLVGALRLDLYSHGDDGLRWYESRTVALPDARDWPASFSLFNPSADQPRRVTVRLRAFPRQATRDYRGERFATAPGPEVPVDTIIEDPPPPPDESPRLIADDRDVTPREEPLPALTIDRLLELELVEGKRGFLHVVLRGSCFGTMADLFGRRSCVEVEGAREEVVVAGLSDEAPPGSFVGSFGGGGDCGPLRPASAGEPLYDEEVCVAGGAYVYGNAEHFGVAEASGVPERVAVMSPFRIDRFEVTVGRWRAALAAGFDPPGGTPVPNDDVLDIKGSMAQVCTYSTFPMGRETHPLNCVSAEAAAAFCAFHGGALPTEAQWEHAAQASGRSRETRYPWGDAEATCERAVYGRSEVFGLFGGADCLAYGAGAASIEASLGATAEAGDVSLGLGIVGLGGSMAEWMADTFTPLDAACWLRQPLRDPACRAPGPLQSVRGGSWAAHVLSLFPGNRSAADVAGSSATGSSNLGFRCARPAW
jgi:formylglycine-generating enzyme required for sulfatase activity